MGHLVAWMVTMTVVGLCVAAWWAGICAIEGAWAGLHGKSTLPTTLREVRTAWGGP